MCVCACVCSRVCMQYFNSRVLLKNTHSQFFDSTTYQSLLHLFDLYSYKLQKSTRRGHTSAKVQSPLFYDMQICKRNHQPTMSGYIVYIKSLCQNIVLHIWIVSTPFTLCLDQKRIWSVFHLHVWHKIFVFMQLSAPVSCRLASQQCLTGINATRSIYLRFSVFFQQ